MCSRLNKLRGSLSLREVIASHAPSALAKQKINMRKIKRVLATHQGEEELEKNCWVLFFLSQSPLGDAAFALTQRGPGELIFPNTPQRRGTGGKFL